MSDTVTVPRDVMVKAVVEALTADEKEVLRQFVHAALERDNGTFGREKRTVFEDIVNTAVDRFVTEAVHAYLREHRAEVQARIEEKLGEELLSQATDAVIGRIEVAVRRV